MSFKAGDRVEYFNSGVTGFAYGPAIGKVGTVAEDNGGQCVTVAFDDTTVGRHGCFRENLRLISQQRAEARQMQRLTIIFVDGTTATAEVETRSCDLEVFSDSVAAVLWH